MASALADFSRRPLPVKIAIFAGIGALLGLLYWQFLLQPLKTERSDAESGREAAQSEARKLKEQKDEYDRKILRQDELKRQIEQNQKALPTEAEMPAFFDMLARRTAEAGVESLSRTVGVEIPIETFVKVPVQIVVSGTFYQLKRFFTSLRPADKSGAADLSSGDVEEKDRIVTIEDLSIGDPKIRNGEIVLVAKFTASTFRAADQAPGAADTAFAPVKPAAAAKPAAAGGPKLTQDPKQMKTQVEAAGAAAEARVKSAVEAVGPPPNAGTEPGGAKGGN